MSTTTDLADFGARERKMLIQLLQAWQDSGLPDGFDDNEVRPMMNKNSGYVFLMNREYQVAMMNGDNLEIFHFTPYEGHEGFLVDLLDEYAPDDLHREDEQYLRDAAMIEHVELPDAWREEA